MNDTSLLPLKIYMGRFDIPHSKRLQFEKIIRSTTPDFASSLSQSSLSRNELIIVIEKSSPSSIINASEKYLKDLYGVILSVEDNGSIRLNEQLSFTWSSFTSPKTFLTGYSLRYELIMTLMVYGMSHYNRASEINDQITESNFDDSAKVLVNHLKTAAGIFDFVHSTELPRWSNPPEDIHLECLSNTSLGLSLLCIALGNSVTVRKAMKQQTSHSIISKISCEAWHKMEMSKNCFKDLSSHNYKKLPKNFRDFLSTNIALNNSITMMEMGRHFAFEKNFSNALSYLSLAVQYITKMKKPNESRQIEIVNALINEINYENQSLVKENDLIYFQKKVDPKSLQQPEPKSFIIDLKFEPPMPSFHY
ncbi:hypothetical protein DFA_09504 [Cavenderia fasciculata]|uniref:BRO1 domain-containing protein n=1 Tax=Cavenderia fasciculata TaxID=261658 RepID=F4Q7T5_CACFS|nr:uncharacterized protein DFA_09504 [Cavenderia fasciculata]EGG15835.1 hypothetical protein DFA_09504 [Cavenderia fasciculata]|eukprot:XP_004352160.1 hypothetical protein DFA_09504 [Cavenderia fasciculata]